MALTQSRPVETAASRLQQLVPRETPVRLPLPVPLGGMRGDKSPEDLSDTESVTQINLRVIGGRLVVDTGYTFFADTYDGQAANTFQAFYSDGTTAELLVTTSSVYIYAPAVNEWQLVSKEASYVTNAPEITGSTHIGITTTTGLTVGATIGIILSNGQQFVTTIGNIAGSDITLDDPLPLNTLTGASIALKVDLNGDISAQNQVKFVMFPANEWVIFTNSVDPVMYYFGGVVKELGGLPTATTCHTLVVSHEQLLIGNTIENSVAFPLRVRASDQADPENWSTGIAAIYNLVDTSDEILSLNILGPYVIAYRASSIMRGTYLGQLNFIWLWEYMVYDEGIISQGAVVERLNEHVFVGLSGVYLYHGDYTLTPIGDPIYDLVFGAGSGELNTIAKDTVFMYYSTNYDEVWIFYPATPSLYPNRMFRYIVPRKSWIKREFRESFVSCSTRYEVSDDTWASAMGIWATDNIQWNSLALTKNVPNLLLCKPNLHANVMKYDYSSVTDNAAPIPWTIVTKQFGDGNTFIRWERINVIGLGDDVLIEYSIDEGRTWTSLQSISLGATESFEYAYIDYASTRIQFRLTGDDPTFQFRHAQLTGVVEAEW